MTEEDRGHCLCKEDRLSNQGLCTLMAQVVKGDRSAARRLSTHIAPLLLAFYEGQAQVGRIRPERVESLAREAFMAVLEHRADYDSTTPFRAWLLTIARATLLDHTPAASTAPLSTPPHLQWAI
ncbi:sigma factor [Pseudomonas sp. SDO524_S393]